MSDPTRITVNGVEYDGVEAMPADVRQVYERMLAGLPDVAAMGATGAPKILEGKFGPVHFETVVRKKIVVNGRTVDDEASLPADVRQALDRARQMASTNEPGVKKAITLTIHTSPHFAMRKTSGGAPQSPEVPLAMVAPMTDPSRPAPIEPAAGVRVGPVLAVAGALVALTALWLATRH